MPEAVKKEEPQEVQEMRETLGDFERAARRAARRSKSSAQALRLVLTPPPAAKDDYVPLSDAEIKAAAERLKNG